MFYCFTSSCSHLLKRVCSKILFLQTLNSCQILPVPQNTSFCFLLLCLLKSEYHVDSAGCKLDGCVDVVQCSLWIVPIEPMSVDWIIQVVSFLKPSFKLLKVRGIFFNVFKHIPSSLWQNLHDSLPHFRKQK